MIIYKATNLVNGKVYIGQTIDTLLKRKRNHENNSFNGHKNQYFNQAIRKYGMKNFVWDEIDLAESVEELDYLEIYWIKWYRSNDRKYGYNLAEGGRVNRGNKWTDEQKQRQSESRKQKFLLGEIKSWNKGVPLRQETKDKLSKSLKGRPAWNKGIPGPSGEKNHFYGKKHTEESRKKISEKNIGRISPNKGKIFSQEVRDKMSKSKRGKSNKHSFKPVICIETGIVYESGVDACKKLGIKSHENLSAVCHGKRKICGGYHWKFYNKENIQQQLTT